MIDQPARTTGRVLTTAGAALLLAAFHSSSINVFAIRTQLSFPAPSDTMAAAAQQQQHSDSDERDESVDEIESEYDEDELEASHSAFMAAGAAAGTRVQRAHTSTQSRQPQPLSSLSWCRPFIERDDAPADDEVEEEAEEEEDDDGLDSADREAAADEELADLTREYGRPLSKAMQSALPTLTAQLGSTTLTADPAVATPAAASHKPIQLLRAYAPGQTPPNDAAGDEEEVRRSLDISVQLPPLVSPSSPIAHSRLPLFCLDVSVFAAA